MLQHHRQITKVIGVVGVGGIYVSIRLALVLVMITPVTRLVYKTEVGQRSRVGLVYLRATF